MAEGRHQPACLPLCPGYATVEEEKCPCPPGHLYTNKVRGRGRKAQKLQTAFAPESCACLEEYEGVDSARLLRLVARSPSRRA